MSLNTDSDALLRTELEQALHLHNGLLAGVDEAGRGPLAGPVYAAAVILRPGCEPAGLDDSKKLTAARREYLAQEIRTHAWAWAVAQASVEEIDHLNILGATLLAMRRAVSALAMRPGVVWVDGNALPRLDCPARAIVQGDARVAAISAASILAKTSRDAHLLELHAQYPQYHFDRHKGYGTALHLAQLTAHGACPAHRRSFAPVSRVCSA